MPRRRTRLSSVEDLRNVTRLVLEGHDIRGEVFEWSKRRNRPRQFTLFTQHGWWMLEASDVSSVEERSTRCFASRRSPASRSARGSFMAASRVGATLGRHDRGTLSRGRLWRVRALRAACQALVGRPPEGRVAPRERRGSSVTRPVRLQNLQVRANACRAR